MLNSIRGRLFQAGAAVSALLLASAAPVQAAPSDSSATNSAAQRNAGTAAPRPAARNNRPVRICVYAEPVTGSRLSGRPICRTQAEWDREGGIPTD